MLMRQASYVPTPEEIQAECRAIRAEPEWVPEHGGERYFLAALLGHMIEPLRRWCSERPRDPEARFDHRYVEARQIARNAAEWLLAEEHPPAGSHKFSFLEICEFLGLDPVATREQIFRQFETVSLAALLEGDFPVESPLCCA